MAEERISDHGMAAEFGQSRTLRQSSRAGCRDEFHGERVAQALARQVAKNNPNMLVSYKGGSQIDIEEMRHTGGRAPTALDDMDPRVVRRRQMEMESDVRRRERDARDAAEKKEKEDKEINKRRAEAAKVRKRQEDGLNERKKLDDQKALKRRERLNLPETATAEQCIKREKKLLKLEREALKEGKPPPTAAQVFGSAPVKAPVQAGDSLEADEGSEGKAKKDPKALLDSLAASWGVVGEKRLRED